MLIFLYEFLLVFLKKEAAFKGNLKLFYRKMITLKKNLNKTSKKGVIYKVIWKKTALKQLAKIDKKIAKELADKVESYLAKDPVNRGKPLLYDYKGFYRYRYNDYRVIYEIKNQELIISVVKVGHRKGVY